MRLGIITALPDEARTLTAPDAADRHAVEICGVGPANAHSAAARLIACGVDGLLSWGTAGALDPDYEPGTLVVYESVLDASGVQYSSDERWGQTLLQTLAALQPLAGRGYTAAAAVASIAGKAHLREQTGCNALDMESAAIAAAAAGGGIPYAAVRVIVDPADFHVPECALRGLDEHGRTHVLPVAMAVLRRPQELPDLLRLGRWYYNALRRLRLATRALYPDFGTA